ncbi:MAG TPA: TonB family protein [Opitutaceae bacterium]
MNAVRKLALVSSLLALTSAAFAATSAEETYLATCRKEPGVPVPVEVVAPRVAQRYAGRTVEVLFTVNEKGQPTELAVSPSIDGELASAVVVAVKQWKFEPAQRDGTPVATKVVLPVRVVDSGAEGSRYAAY